MRYYFLAIILISFSCKNHESLTPNDNLDYNLATKDLIFGKWKLLENKLNTKFPYEIILELKNEKNEKGKYVLSGKSSINFYQASFTINDNYITIGSISVTEISGNALAKNFEEEYLRTLSEVNHFEISNETLTLNNNRDKLILYTKSEQLIFKKNN